jgi:hypothetical protein
MSRLGVKVYQSKLVLSGNVGPGICYKNVVCKAILSKLIYLLNSTKYHEYIFVLTRNTLRSNFKESNNNNIDSSISIEGFLTNIIYSINEPFSIFNKLNKYYTDKYSTSFKVITNYKLAEIDELDINFGIMKIDDIYIINIITNICKLCKQIAKDGNVDVVDIYDKLLSQHKNIQNLKFEDKDIIVSIMDIFYYVLVISKYLK